MSPIAIAFHRILFAEASRLPELCAGMYQRRKTAAIRFIRLIIARPLSHALLGAPPMSEAAREAHVRESVALFLHGAGLPQRSRAARRPS